MERITQHGKVKLLNQPTDPLCLEAKKLLRGLSENKGSWDDTSFSRSVIIYSIQGNRNHYFLVSIMCQALSFYL